MTRETMWLAISIACVLVLLSLFIFVVFAP